MSSVPLTVLPFDVCDRLLTFLPDFLSLRSAVLSSRHMYDAFTPRKRSITHAVEINEVGPALRFAISLIRTMRVIGQEPLQDILQGLNNPDLESAYWTTDVSGVEAQVLSGVSSVVRRLESYFCILYKDRTAPVSILSEEERLKFHRAIYRVWILSILAADNHKHSNPNSLDTAFLKKMSEEELVEMHEATLFLDVLYRKMMCKRSRLQGTYAHTPRPFQFPLDHLLAALDGWTNPHSWSISMQRSGSVIFNDYLTLRNGRKIVKLFEEKYSHTSILANPRVESIQACQKCNVQTLELFGENNWHLLHPALDLIFIMECLPGKLNFNSCVRTDMFALFEHRTSFASMLGEMFDSQNDPESGWKNSDWLCMQCIKNFVRERLFSWLVNELVKAGNQFKENCWYGWNCRTQTHKYEHAKKLNHLCEPTDRDDTNKTSNNNHNSPHFGASEIENGTEDDFEDDTEGDTESEWEDDEDTEDED